MQTDGRTISGVDFTLREPDTLNQADPADFLAITGRTVSPECRWRSNRES